MSDELPAGWAIARLSDVAPLQPGYAFKSTWFCNSGVRLLRGTNVVPGGTRWEDVEYLRVEDASRFRPFELRDGDIVLAMDRPVISAGLKLARLTNSDLPALLLQRVGRFQPTPRVVPEYLFHWLSGPLFRDHLVAHLAGTQLPHVSASEVGAAAILLPPLEEQRNIASYVSSARRRGTRAKSALDDVPALLDRLRQSILAAAFRGDLTADWREANPDVEPASELLQRIRAERRRRWEEAELAKMVAKGKPPKDDRWKSKYVEPAPVDDPPAELPRGWCWSRIDTVGDLLLGRRRAELEYIPGQNGRTLHPYVRVANVKDDRLDLADVLEMAFSPQEVALYKLRTGDIVLSEGQSLERVGQSAMYRGEFARDLCIQATVHRFRAFDGLDPEFAQLAFMHFVRSGVFRSAAAITTNIAHLTSERLRPLRFPLAPAAEQREIVRRARAVLNCASSLSDKTIFASDSLSQLDSAILAAAFRGELVRDADTDARAAE